MYSCNGDGVATDWHIVHLGSRAVGGAGLVFTEATSVEARGMISEQDLGIWNDAQAAALEPTVHFVKKHGAVIGMQLAHAGRKAWSGSAWDRRNGVGPHPAFAPSPIPYEPTWPALEERSTEEVRGIVDAFAAGATRAVGAGFQALEIHAAHGYLLHNFLSPISNQRTDEYGGSFENRTRLVVEVCDAIRKVIPDSVPLWVRMSSTDWMEWSDQPSWTVEQSIELARCLVKEHGVDLIDCSSAGTHPDQRVPRETDYQVARCARIRKEAGVPTGAVGLITTPEQADDVIASGKADVVILARQELRDPYFPLTAARALGEDIQWPLQYDRAKLR